MSLSGMDIVSCILRTEGFISSSSEFPFLLSLLVLVFIGVREVLSHCTSLMLVQNKDYFTSSLSLQSESCPVRRFSCPLSSFSDVNLCVVSSFSADSSCSVSLFFLTLVYDLINLCPFKGIDSSLLSAEVFNEKRWKGKEILYPSKLTLIFFKNFLNPCLSFFSSLCSLFLYFSHAVSWVFLWDRQWCSLHTEVI